MTKASVIKATVWSFIGIYGTQAITFTVNIFLARILEPEQFGLIAMIIVFSNFGQIFLNFGFSHALIQDLKPSQEDLSTVFFFNIGMGVILSCLLYAGSNSIANFYSQPGLVKLTQVISLVFIFNAFSIVQRAMLLRKINLKSEMAVIILSSLISGSIAVFLAYRGFGIWALVAKMVTHSFLESLLLWFLNDWRPTLSFRIASLRKFFKFSLNMFGAGIFSNLKLNIDNLIIGKLFSAVQLGFFERSKNLNSLVQSGLGAAFVKVMFPVLSNLQEDDEKFIVAYRKTIRMVALLVIPLFLGLIVLAKPLIVVLITEKWLPSAQFLQILAASGFIFPLSAIMVNAIVAKGRADIFFQLDVVKTTLFIGFVFAGSIWGVTGVVVGMAAFSYLGIFINMFAVSKVLKLPIIKQCTDIVIPAFLAALMLFLLVVVSNLSKLSFIGELMVLPLVGIAFYLTTNYLFNRKIFVEIKDLIQAVRTGQYEV